MKFFENLEHITIMGSAYTSVVAYHIQDHSYPHISARNALVKLLQGVLLQLFLIHLSIIFLNPEQPHWRKL